MYLTCDAPTSTLGALAIKTSNALSQLQHLPGATADEGSWTYQRIEGREVLLIFGHRCYQRQGAMLVLMPVSRKQGRCVRFYAEI